MEFIRNATLRRSIRTRRERRRYEGIGEQGRKFHVIVTTLENEIQWLKSENEQLKRKFSQLLQDLQKRTCFETNYILSLSDR